MTRRGPKRKVSDERLLFELLANDNRAFATEVTDHVALETVQGTRDRLNTLAADSDYCEVKKISGRNLFRLTDSGRDHVVNAVRSRLD